MNIYHYETAGGKDLILEYVDGLPKKERAEGLTILSRLENDGLYVLKVLNTRQLKKKLWEIKFCGNNRIMYVIVDEENMYLIHACKKQKNKTERFELDTCFRRVKELEEKLGRKLL